ncbi:response regulator transcription factor [bacterium]|nr:response regulator transcription factor [bacterium]
MKTRCMIVDDEPLAIEVIKSYLKRFNDVQIVATCNDAIYALEVLKNERIDLLFLDIQLPYIKGTAFLRSLTNPPKVILITAFRDYAVEGFDLNVLDYLLKPISFERFIKAMDKYFQRSNNTMDNMIISNPAKIRSREFINIKSDRKMVHLVLDDIVYIEGMKDYINIVTLNKPVITDMPLQQLEEMLPPELFLRIHRSYIIAIDKIYAFTSEIVEIMNKQLPIGRHYKKTVLERIM